MKVGILTLPLHTNYGGILQAYALQEVLRRQGHQVKVIDKDFQPHKTDRYRYPRRIFLKYIFRQNIPVHYERLLYEEYQNKMLHILPFLEKYIFRKMVHDLSEIKRGEFDVLVIGSDQIWRPSYFLHSYEKVTDAFGRFANKLNIECLSYAASFGIDNLEEFDKKEIIKIKKEILKFKGVSVRESRGVELCREYFGVDATHVLDPTLLLSKKEYENLIDSTVSSRKGIMKYVLDPTREKDHVVQEVKRRLDLPVFSTNLSGEKVQPSVEQWLAGFRDAEMIVTDSFHACVFSIIFRKPFVVVANPNRGISRIMSLLEIFGLQHHLVANPDQIKPVSSYEINDAIYTILSKWQNRSMDFLLSSLK